MITEAFAPGSGAGSVPAVNSVWRSVRAAAVGLVAAGAVAVVVAAFVLPADPVPPGPGRVGMGVLIGLTLLLVAAGLCAQRFDRAEVPRKGLLLPLLAAGGCLAWAVVGLVQQWGVGFPGPVRMLGAVGAGAVVIGLALLMVSRPASPGVPRRIDVLRGLAAGGMALLVAGLLTAATPGFGLVAHTGAYVAPAQVPRSVSRVAWRTETAAPIDAVVAGGSGVVVTVDGGAEGVDGATGAVRWVYRRPGAGVNVEVSPDGRTVLLQLFPRAPWQQQEPQVVVLDANTGRVRFHLWQTTGPATVVKVSDQVWVSESGGALVGRSVADDRVLWRYRAPAGCYLDSSPTAEPVALRSGVVVLDVCGRPGAGRYEARFVDLGPRPTPRWQYRIPVAYEDDPVVRLVTPPDGAMVEALDLLTPSRPTSLVLDGATGARLRNAQQVYDGYLGVERYGSKDLIDLRSGQRVGPAPEQSEAAVLPAQSAWQADDAGDPAAVVLQGRSGVTHTLSVLRTAPRDPTVELVAAPGALVVAADADDELVGLK